MENPIGDDVDPSVYRTSGRASQELKEKRINYVSKLLSNFVGYADITRHIEEVFDVSERQAEYYIKDARESMADIAQEQVEEREKFIGQSIQRMQYLYEKAMEEGNTNQMIRLQNMFNKMQAAYSKNVNVQESDDENSNVIFNLPEKDE